MNQIKPYLTYPRPLTEQELEEMRAWRVYDDGTAFVCQKRAGYFGAHREKCI